jgi:hypothetical protein
VPINVILQAGISGRIGASQVVQRERGRIRQDDPVPDDLHTTLPKEVPSLAEDVS